MLMSVENPASGEMNISLSRWRERVGGRVFCCPLRLNPLPEGRRGGSGLLQSDSHTHNPTDAFLFQGGLRHKRGGSYTARDSQ